MIDRFSWVAAYPQIVLLVMTCVIALADLFDHSKRRATAYVLTILTLLLTAGLSAIYAVEDRTIYGFGGAVVSDTLANWLTCFACIATLVVLIYGRSYVQARGMVRGGGEWYSLNLLALLGTLVLCTGNNLLVLYLGLELLTLSSYALVALRRDDATAVEAAMKYFVLGSLASGFLLYGLSMVYGATGTLDVGSVYEAIATGQIQHKVLVFGLVFVVAGVAFKFGAAPFHMWLPDVYQGAPTAVTLVIGAAPKLAAFALAMRLLAQGLLPLAVDWQPMLAVLVVVSLLVGNLAAIAQTNLKRMLAYSTIAQMGFVLIGLLAGTVQSNTLNAANAYGSAMFYIVSYVLTTLVSFGVIVLLSREGFESEEISDLAGLNQRSPWYAAVMLICMMSLAGIPLFVGFPAKFSVLQALLSTGESVYVGLAVFAVLMSVVGAFYYIRVIKVMYFDAPPASAAPIAAPADMRVVLSINGLLILVLGIFPGGLLKLCTHAVIRMLTT
ncbi:MAG: NADH-quinone oxidoreductase subunit NuoN [Burkholderiaceae bacterium]|jgi:NADH-quinone oxidoreductase subunit N|nr:NADH-quinone oxidoreductase subunit NuoN [Burkholderiaceae bacterium]